MHVYLLVNVLLLGITVALWCQGKLPHTTPAPLKEFESAATGQKLRKRHYALMSQVWLMTGSALAMAGSFSFILLSIWMAMHPGFGKQVLVDRCPSLLEHSGLPFFEAFRRYGGRKGSAFQAVLPEHCMPATPGLKIAWSTHEQLCLRLRLLKTAPMPNIAVGEHLARNAPDDYFERGKTTGHNASERYSLDGWGPLATCIEALSLFLSRSRRAWGLIIPESETLRWQELVRARTFELGSYRRGRSQKRRTAGSAACQTKGLKHGIIFFSDSVYFAGFGIFRCRFYHSRFSSCGIFHFGFHFGFGTSFGYGGWGGVGGGLITIWLTAQVLAFCSNRSSSSSSSR